MTKTNPGYSVTDLEKSDEEELIMTLLARALNESPKTTRGTSTIKEWMAIIEHSDELKQSLALNSSQQQDLETFALANPDMELDTYHIRCIYSMILKSQPLSTATAPPPLATKQTANSNKSLRKQNSSYFMQPLADQAPASPTPSLEQPQRVESSESCLIEQPDDMPSFRFQNKTKKVSIGPTLEYRGSSDGDENSHHKNSGDDRGNDKYDEGFAGPSIQRLSNNLPEQRLHFHQQNNKLSFQPVDEHWTTQIATGTSASNDQQRQQTDRNTALLGIRVKDMENELQTLRRKIRQHEELEAHQLQQIEELKCSAKATEQQYHRLERQKSDQVEELRATLDSSQSSLSKANQRCAKLEDHLTQSQRDANYNKSTLEQAQIEVDHWKAALEQSQNDAAQWKAALQRNSAELALLHKDRDHDRVAHDRLELELEQKEDELKKTQQRVEQLQNSIPPDMTLLKVEETLKKVARLEKDRGISDALIISTKDKLAKLTKDYEASQRRIEELKGERRQGQGYTDTTIAPPKALSRYLSFWNPWEAITHRRKLMEQLDAQANVIEHLRSQILSNGSTIDQVPMEKQSSYWWLPILGILGLLFIIVLSGIVYAIHSPPAIYGLWNDPHGYQGQWLPDAPMPRNWILLMLDRLLLPRNHTFVPPI